MKRNSKLLRTLSVLAVIALVCLGLALHTGTGTPSAWGIYDIAAICPLGAAEAALASKTVVPPMPSRWPSVLRWWCCSAVRSAPGAARSPC